MTKRCKTCRHWSEMVAKVEAGTTVAMCMNSQSPEMGNYKAKWGTCDQHEDGMPDDLDHVSAGQRERSLAYREALLNDGVCRRCDRGMTEREARFFKTVKWSAVGNPVQGEGRITPPPREEEAFGPYCPNCLDLLLKGRDAPREDARR